MVVAASTAARESMTDTDESAPQTKPLIEAAMPSQFGFHAFVISQAVALSLVCFLVLSLRNLLRTRKLTISAIMAYVAGAGLAMALPSCFHLKFYQHADIVAAYYDFNLFSLGLGYVLLAITVLSIYNTSWQQ
jgi:hypothetical protein